MSTEERSIEDQFTRELEAFMLSYQPATHSATIDTQREFQQGLFHLEQTYSDRLDDLERGERKGFDEAYRLGKVWELNDEERSGWKHARTDHHLFGNRGAYQDDRAELSRDNPNPSYRQSGAYQAGMQELVETQVVRRDALDSQLRGADQLLNERFGFDRNPPQEAAPSLEDIKGAFAARVNELQQEHQHDRED